MDFNAFTQKSQQAILSARDLATQRTQPYVEPEHLLAGLLAQTDGLIYPILGRLGVHATDITVPVERSLSAIPAVVGGSEASFSPDSLGVFEDADSERRSLKDDYVSVEHLLLAPPRPPDQPASF